MIEAGRSLGSGLPLLAGVILDEGLVQRAPDEADALVIEVLRILAGQLAGLLGNNSASLIRGVGGGEELVDGAQIDRHGVHHTVVSGVNVMHVWSERREAVDVLPHALIGRVEQMGAVLVNLDTGTRIRLGVGGTADAVAFGFTLAAMVALWSWLRFGRDGLAVRATAADPDAARQMGVPVTRVQNLSFLLASCLGGVGGIFFGMYAGVISPYSASFTGTVGFIAAAVGGLGSIAGAVAGGFVIGLLESLGIYQFGGGFRDLFIFGAFLLVLLLRPHGLFGSRHAVVSEPMTGTFLGAGRPIRLTWWHWAVLALAAGLAVPLLGGPVLSSVGTQVAIYAIIAVPMTLLAGSTGQISLGQAAPVAIGAYASALLVMRLGLPFLLALLLAGVIAAVLATAVTLPIWKLDGHYVSMATLALGYIVLSVIRSWDTVTKGAYGLSGIPSPEVFGLPLLVAEDHYQFDLVVLGITLFVVFRLRASHLGTVLASVGSDEVAARSLGLHTRGYKALTYAIAAFFAGLAGALLAHQYNYLDPTVFTVQMSVLVLTIVVLGGMNSPFGAVLGALALVGLPEALRLAPDVRILLYGIVVIAIIRFLPQGLWTRRA